MPWRRAGRGGEVSLGPHWWPSTVYAILGPKAVTRVGRQQVVSPELG
jgi:hypothetical protein